MQILCPDFPLPRSQHQLKKYESERKLVRVSRIGIGYF